MINQTRTLRLPNSLLLVQDSAAAEPPDSFSGRLITASPTCIAIGTLSEADGETTVRLVDSNERALPALEEFVGELDTPSRYILVSTVDGQEIMRQLVEEAKVRVRIYVSHSVEPDDVAVVIG